MGGIPFLRASVLTGTLEVRGSLQIHVYVDTIFKLDTLLFVFGYVVMSLLLCLPPVKPVLNDNLHSPDFKRSTRLNSVV